MSSFPKNAITRLSLYLVAVASFTFYPQYNWAAIPGDFNLDGKRGLVDVIMIMQELSGQFHDVDGDGYTSATDCDDTNTAINPGLPEICDGLDNNCNLIVDEELFRSCYSGPQGTEGVGTCQSGTSTCSGGSWASCIDDILPAEEICDGLDNNCDGTVDESLFRSCYSGPSGTEGVGICQGGTSTCSGGNWASCIDDILPAEETCDGVDNDCDGTVDENCPSCVDGQVNGEETDTDCGGSTCPDCGNGASCIIGSDCVSGVCTNQTCQAPTCSDGVKNGTETDLDCGGSCVSCALGQTCLEGADCQSNICLSGHCWEVFQ